MKTKAKFCSIKYKITLLLVMLLIIFTLFVIAGAQILTNLTMRRVYENTQNMLALYEKNIETTIDQVDSYLFTLSVRSNDLPVLQNKPLNSTEWFGSLYRTEEELQSAENLYDVDSLFAYIPEKKAIVSKSLVSAQRNAIKNGIDNETFSYQRWQLTRIDGDYYYLRVFPLGGYYLGAMTSAQNLLNALIYPDMMPEQEISFIDDAGNVLTGKEKGVTQVDVSHVQSNQFQSYEEIQGTQALIVLQQVTDSNGFLMTYIPRSMISGSIARGTYAALFIGFMLVGFFIIAFFLRKWVTSPVTRINTAIKAVIQGNLNAYIDDTGISEFDELADTYNGMLAQIQNLKIENYDKQLSEQKVRTQFLKQQITPHFMINSLNTIYQLAEIENLELVKKMLISLSRHLRYTLSSGNLVPLSEEAQMTDNFITLSSIRYPSSIAYFASIDDDAGNCRIPPLLLLGFIENTIKHEITVGVLKEIHVAASITADDILQIEIWDTGKGFSEEILTQLQDADHFAEEEQYHIGIANIIQRTKAEYPAATFAFSNRQNAGAQIDIQIPEIRKG